MLIMTDREIIEYYGQIWDNVRHNKAYIKKLKMRFKTE
jgi:hypothetical protein